MALIKIKRGTEAQILAAILNAGEMAFSTDTKEVFIGDGSNNSFVGRVIIDVIANIPSFGVSGRFFYATDENKLYVDNVSSWVLISSTIVEVSDDGFIYGRLYEEWRATIDLTGFYDRTSSTISMNSSYLEITPVLDNYIIFSNGKKYVIDDTRSVEITNDLTLHYVYFNSSGVLQVSTSIWDFLSNNVLVATVFKDGSNYIIGEERHSAFRNREWHNWAHYTVSTRYGYGLTGIFGNSSLSVSQGSVSDEDINIDTLSTKTSCALWYRGTGGVGMRVEKNVSVPYKSSGGLVQYDNNGTLTNVDLNKYVANYVYATTGYEYPIYVVVGQNVYNNIDLARSDSLPIINLSTAEWKLIYRVIYRNVVGTPTYIEAQDYRIVNTGLAISAIANDHQALINRDVLGVHPLSAIEGVGTMAYVDDVSVDDKLYLRKNQDWFELTTIDGGDF